MIEVRNLSVTLANRAILRKISFSLSDGEFLAVLGPNGGGKSTLIRAILGLQDYAGTIKYAGGENTIGYVPQIKTLDRSFPARAEELVATALKKRWPWSIDEHCKGVVSDALRQVGADHLIRQQIRNLSGGELQRVYLARAIISQPSLLVLDEPASGVDVVGASDMLEFVEEYRKKNNAAVIMATHDWEIAFHHASHVLILKTDQISFGTASEAMSETAIRTAFGHVGHSHEIFGGGHVHA